MYDYDEKREAPSNVWEAASEIPDPWDGEHDIEDWTWDGTRLVPASAQELAQIREDERTFAALRRLRRRQEAERRAARAARPPAGSTLLDRVTQLASVCLMAIQSLHTGRSRRGEAAASLRAEPEHPAEV